MMPYDTLANNYGVGPQNVVTGNEPQFNNNGDGGQYNYYSVTRDPQVNEAERRHIEKEACLRSLIFPNINTRRHNIDDAHPNTCEWLFRTPEFIEWWSREHILHHNGVLWIKGKPGSGKSTLMNHALTYCEKVLKDHLIMAYFFNARGGVLEKTPLGMLRSILYQLLSKDATIYEAFLDTYHEKKRMYHEGELLWQQSELKKFLQSIVKQPQPQSRPLLLVVDALDECNEEDVRDVVGFLEGLSVKAVQVGVELRICLSSETKYVTYTHYAL
ncbi:hypothetical protein GGS24DRAFT_442279 [Hypoxylon argillaceum]|nr:hypothetical protein GGS24DRAFT_442279 [Hypoxylon argillaceum]